MRHAWFAMFGTLVALSLLTGSGWAWAAGSHAATTPNVASATGTAASPRCGPLTRFNRHNFAHSTIINNRRLPLKPGTLFTFQGQANRGGGLLPHRVETVVTDLTKVIHGVRTRVLVEQDMNAGQMEEAELAFFAQDNTGNVWLVGEYPEEYENGKFDKAPAWISGQKGARAGIAMPAEPQKGAPDYAQGFAPPPVEFTDRARGYKMGQKTCTPV